MRLLGVFSFLFFFTACGMPSAYGQQYGYVRVIIADHVEHHSMVQLMANGHPLGALFDHSTLNYPWQPVGIEHLSASSNSTPIIMVYRFENSTCEFNFYVEFSFDQATVVARWGPFHAPKSGNAGALPIGTKCQGHMRVCSSNPMLNAQLVAAYTRSLVTEFNRQKAEYDRNMRQRLDASRSNAIDAAKKMNSQRKPDYFQSDRVLKEFLDSYQAEFDRLREESKTEFGDGSNAGKENPSLNTDTDKISNESVEEGRRQAREKAFEDLKKTTPGEIAAGLLQADQGLAELVKEREELIAAERRDGIKLPTDAQDIENGRQSLDFFRREILRGEHFMKSMTKLMEKGIKKIPYVGTSIAICEVVTGKKMCLEPGLSFNERLEKACAFSVSKGLKWTDVRGIFFVNENAILAKTFDHAVESGACDRFKEEKK